MKTLLTALIVGLVTFQSSAFDPGPAVPVPDASGAIDQSSLIVKQAAGDINSGRAVAPAGISGVSYVQPSIASRTDIIGFTVGQNALSGKLTIVATGGDVQVNVTLVSGTVYVASTSGTLLSMEDFLATAPPNNVLVIVGVAAQGDGQILTVTPLQTAKAIQAGS